MPVVHCPACRQALSVADGLGGHVVTCPACQKPMTLPDLPPAVAARPDYVAPGYAAEPEPAARERKRDWTPIALVGGAAVLGLIGVVVVVWQVAAAGRGTEAKKADPPPKVAPAPAPKAKGDPARMDDATVARIKKATVYIRITGAKSVSSGSGFFVDKGAVVTNYHVVSPKGKIEVVVNSGTPQTQTFPARVIGTDPGTDLALLEVDGAFAPNPLKVTDTTALRETHEVYIFGFPFGEELGEEITVVKSTVSSLRGGGGRGVQLNGGLHPGNSGGPVTDAGGRVVGVAVSALRGTQIHFAIAGEDVRNFLDNTLRR